MKELKKILINPKSKEQIKNALKQICRVLPHKLRGNCKDFIEKYSDKIADYIINNISLDSICSLLQLCSKEVAQQDDTLYFLPKLIYNSD